MTDRNETAHGDMEQFNALLLYLKRTRGFDFSGYKPASLMRRLLKRMEIVEKQSFKDYTDFLEVHPEECALLFNHLLINVTSFFRDVAAWEFLKQEVLPKLIQSKPNEQIRVWSAGCAAGHEPYSLAILFCELLGKEEFQQRVKIYASDIDQEALAEARVGSYGTKELQGLDQNLIKTYFDGVGDRYTVRADLRRCVIFGRHDLQTDAPISRLDLLVCRNTLMYFNAEMQNRILARFHFALNDSGYLFLGKAEMLLTYADLFTPVELKYRIFSRVATVTIRDRLQLLNQIGDEESGARLTRHLRMRELALESLSIAMVMVDVDGNLTLINDVARRAFGLTQSDLGRPFRDLEFSYRPVELRGPLEQACSERKRVRLSNVERHLPTGSLQYLEVEVVPLVDNGGTVTGAGITFHDVSVTHQLQAALQRSKQELETAYEELQSTNEELETMNEELQSTNEELQTVNNELRERTDDLQHANVFRESILASLQSGVAVLDDQLNVQIWNDQAVNLWGLRSEETKGRSFMNLDIGLPVSQLSGLISACLKGDTSSHAIKVTAINRRGKPFTCRVTCSPLKNSPASLNNQDAAAIRGVVLFMEEWDSGGASMTTH